MSEKFAKDISENRRPLKSRGYFWVPGVTRWLLARGATPNVISTLSIVAALLAAISIFALCHAADALHASLYGLCGIIAILLRALCNLFDGLLAVEGGLKSPTGELWNDVPDRISDLLMFVTTGYALALPYARELGWAAGSMAVFTAYTRQLAATQTGKQNFAGLLPKPKRFALLGLGILAAIIEAWMTEFPMAYGLWIALALLTLGCIITSIQRLYWVSKELHHA